VSQHRTRQRCRREEAEEAAPFLIPRLRPPANRPPPAMPAVVTAGRRRAGPPSPPSCPRQQATAAPLPGREERTCRQGQAGMVPVEARETTARGVTAVLQGRQIPVAAVPRKTGSTGTRATVPNVTLRWYVSQMVKTNNRRQTTQVQRCTSAEERAGVLCSPSSQRNAQDEEIESAAEQRRRWGAGTNPDIRKYARQKAPQENPRVAVQPSRARKGKAGAKNPRQARQ